MFGWWPGAGGDCGYGGCGGAAWQQWGGGGGDCGYGGNHQPVSWEEWAAQAKLGSRFDDSSGAAQGSGSSSRWDEGAPSGNASASGDRPARASRFDEGPSGHNMAQGGGSGPSRWDAGAPPDAGAAPRRSRFDEGPPGACKGGSMGVGAGNTSARRPQYGDTLTGTVKSYSSVKGFGFIMHPEIPGDIWFASDAVAPELRSSDLAGDEMTFTLFKAPDNKPQARNLRPPGSEPPQGAKPGGPIMLGVTPQGVYPIAGAGKGGIMLPGKGACMPGKGCMAPGQCGARPLFIPGKGFVAAGPGGCWTVPPGGACPGGMGPGGVPPSGFSLLGPRGPDGQPLPQPAQPKKALSPHAGSRAIAGAHGMKATEAAPSRSRSRSRSSSASSKSSSSSSRARKKKKKKRKKKKRKKSSDSGSSSSRSRSRSKDDIKTAAELLEKTNTGGGGSEIEVAKREALAKLTQLQSVEPKEERAKQWRLLLRNWHPDKNPDKSEVATAVFQFLQKGKGLINL